MSGRERSFCFASWLGLHEKGSSLRLNAFFCLWPCRLSEGQELHFLTLSLQPWIAPTLLKLTLQYKATCALQQGNKAKSEHLSHVNITFMSSSHLTLPAKTTLPPIKII